MRLLVLYQSKTGFTRRYAEWIHEEVRCDIRALKGVREDDLAPYDVVVYGARVYAGKIAGLRKVRRMIAANGGTTLLLFATGATPAAAHAKVDAIWENNLTETEKRLTPHFYMQGGLCYEKMNFFDRTLLKFAAGMNNLRDGRDLNEAGHKSAIVASYDSSSKDQLEPLLDRVRAVDPALLRAPAVAPSPSVSDGTE